MTHATGMSGYSEIARSDQIKRAIQMYCGTKDIAERAYGYLGRVSPNIGETTLSGKLLEVALYAFGLYYEYCGPQYSIRSTPCRFNPLR